MCEFTGEEKLFIFMLCHTTESGSSVENEVEPQVFASEVLKLLKRPELYVIWFYALSLA